MRIGFITVFLICITSSSNSLPNAGLKSIAETASNENSLVAGDFFATIDMMLPDPAGRTAHDEFAIQAAEWFADQRLLVVKARTTHTKGTLLTLMGLPASTMVDAFRISSDYTAEYRLPIEIGRAIPCQIMVRSAFATEAADVVNAPSACDRRVAISGTAAISATSPMRNAWVTVVVDNVAFTTFTDDSGSFSLQVYSESEYASITITAEGILDDRESVLHIYDGSINALLSANSLTSSTTWAAEILGRRHARPMHAALDNRRPLSGESQER